MRGDDQRQGGMFSYVSLEKRVPEDHPLRPIRAMVNEALSSLSDRFEKLYAKSGRPSIPPERLLRALLVQMLFSVRSERQLMEQLDYNLLFRWFVGLGMDDEVWDPTTFTKNRDRLLSGDVASAFFEQVLKQAEERGLLSRDHFTVDGTLVEAWASMKSFRRKGGAGDDPPPDDPGNPHVDFHGEKRSNETHESTTDPEAKLAKKGKGKEAKLSYMGHVLSENRNGLVVASRLTQADGYAEREAAKDMVSSKTGDHQITVGADKAYDTKDLVADLRDLGATPHVAQNKSKNRSSAIDGRTTRHPGYEVSQRKRKRVEEIFGWMKTVALFRKVRHRGRRLVEWLFTLAATGYNLVRMRNLALQPV